MEILIREIPKVFLIRNNVYFYVIVKIVAKAQMLLYNKKDDRNEHQVLISAIFGFN